MEHKYQEVIKMRARRGNYEIEGKTKTIKPILHFSEKDIERIKKLLKVKFYKYDENGKATEYDYDVLSFAEFVEKAIENHIEKIESDIKRLGIEKSRF
jgi:tRNA(Ile)-lysidine synthase TilS/MesJ